MEEDSESDWSIDLRGGGHFFIVMPFLTALCSLRSTLRAGTNSLYKVFYTFQCVTLHHGNCRIQCFWSFTQTTCAASILTILFKIGNSKCVILNQWNIPLRKRERIRIVKI